MIIFIICCIFVAYCLVILSIASGFYEIKPFINTSNKPKKSFSVVIPFRNEEKQLPALIKSITSIDYNPKLVEFIFVNDDSSDGSTRIINEFISSYAVHDYVCLINNIRNTNAPKKDAINTALKIVKYDWIITTDADCILPKNWLHAYNNYIVAKDPNMVIGPVSYFAKNNLLEQFQLADFLSLQITSIGSSGMNNPLLCNGANLAYSSAVFKAVKGFEGNENFASGDDIFLLEKFRNYDLEKIGFLKTTEALVYTYPMKSVKALIDQRVRWASKTSHTSSTITKALGIIVMLWNILLLLSPALLLLNYLSLDLILFLILVKVGTDSFCIITMANFYKTRINPLFLIISILIYPVYSTYIIVKSLTGSFTWKGRTFRK